MEIAIVVVLIIAVSIMGGMTGVGGVLFIPILVVILGMDTHIATSTVLASMILPATFGGIIYARKGAFDTEMVFCLGIGGAVFGSLGGVLKAYSSAELITVILAVTVIIAGSNALRPPKPGAVKLADASPKVRRIFLLILGSIVGILSGLAGSGGAVLTIAIMIFLGFAPLPTVCAGILYTLPVGVSASIPSIINGYIDYFTLAWTALAQFAGMFIGISIATRVSTTMLRYMVASMCIFTGIFLLARVIWQTYAG